MSICPFCKQDYQMLKYHEKYCHSNPNRESHPGNGGLTKGRIAWNKGLTKDTDERVKKGRDTLIKHLQDGSVIPSLKGKHHTEESKSKIGKAIKQRMAERAGTIGFIAHHSSKKSYPEQYFEDVFKLRNIPLLYHKQVSRFELDFYNEEHKRYVEVDGEQHYMNEENILRDINREHELEERGWKGMRIRWSSYKKMSVDEKDQLIEHIRSFVIGEKEALEYVPSDIEIQLREKWLKTYREKEAKRNETRSQKTKARKLESNQNAGNYWQVVEQHREYQKKICKSVRTLINTNQIDLTRWDRNKQLLNLLAPEYGNITAKALGIALLQDPELHDQVYPRKSLGSTGQKWIHNPMTGERKRIKIDDLHLYEGWI